MRTFRVLLCVLMVLGLSGCLSNPFSKWTTATKKVETTQDKIQKNEDSTVEAVKSYNYGVKLSLDLDPAPSKYSTLASDFNNKSVAILGSPSLQEINDLKIMVSSLLSTNAKIIAKGQEQLNELDQKVYRLQSEKIELGVKLDNAEKRLVEVGGLNSKIASTWTSIKRVGWWILWAVIGYGVFRVLGAVCPPPYNSAFGIIDFVIGGFIRGVFKLIPKAMDGAKVVGQEYKETVNQLVESIETSKVKVEAQNEVLGKKSVGLETLKTELNTNTDAKTKAVISQTKQDLGY